MNPTNCVVLVPVGKYVEPDCEEALRELERRGYPVRRVHGYSAIDAARNQMATNALRDGFDELMWIDSDVVFDPGDIDHLRGLNLPVVCGLYAKKSKTDFACRFLLGTRNVTFGADGGLIEILYGGFGFMLVRRPVFDAVQAASGLPVCNEAFGRPLVPYFQPMVVPLEPGCWYLSEDYAFCERVRRADYRVMADTRVRLWHLGTYPYTWEDLDQNLPG